jgi:hypothetical protein
LLTLWWLPRFSLLSPVSAVASCCVFFFYFFEGKKVCVAVQQMINQNNT